MRNFLLAGGIVVLCASTECFAYASAPVSRHPLTQMINGFQAISFYEDAVGALWIVGTNGVYRYDAHSLVIAKNTERKYEKHEFKKSRNLVSQDRQGRLWLITPTGGLEYYRPATAKFSAAQEIVGGLPSQDSHLENLVHDSQGNMWVSNADLQLHSINTQNLTTHAPIDLTAYIPANDRIQTIVSSAGIGVWVATSNGTLLKCFAGKASCLYLKASKLLDVEGDIHFSSLVEQDKNRVIVSTLQNGVFAVDVKNATSKSLIPDIPQRQPLILRNLKRSKSGELWLGAQSGLYKLSSSNTLTQYDTSNSDIRSNLIDELTPGRSRNTLLFTNSSGVFTVPESRFETIDLGQKVYTPNITSFEAASSKRIYFGSFAGIYSVLTGKGIGSNNQPIRVNALDDQKIATSLAVVEEELWVGYLSKGISALERSEGILSKPRIIDSETKAISCLESLSGKKVAVCSAEQGIQIRKTDGSLLDVVKPNKLMGIDTEKESVYAVLQLKDEEVMVGTNIGAILFSINSITGKIDRSKVTSYLKNRFVLSLLRDNNGDVWAGTELDGLHKLSGGNAFEKVITHPPLPSETIYRLEEDDLGYIWASTYDGLVRVDPDTLDITIYDTSDGLPDNEFNQGASFKDSEGYLYFGGVKGFVRFNPADFVEVRKPPPLRLTDIKIANESVAYDPLYAPPDRVVLKHDDHSVDFSFSTMDIYSPGRSRYQYMLAGFDRQWIDAGRRNTASFTSLPSGDYTLRVIGADSDGVWNYDGISLPIRVLPPPWLTWWAFAIYAALVAGFALLLKRYYETRVLNIAVSRKARMLTATATRAMDELKEQLDTEERLVINIRQHAADTMNTLDELLEMEAKEVDDAVAQETISRSRQRVQCLSALESGVFFHLDIVKVNFREVVEKIFQTVTENLPRPHYELVLANECDEELIPIDIGLPLTIMTHEIILNSATHAFEESEGVELISIKFEKRPDQGWLLHISDSGVGLPGNITPDVPTTLGMELIQKMADQMGARVTVSRQRGTAYTVEIPRTRL